MDEDGENPFAARQAFLVDLMLVLLALLYFKNVSAMTGTIALVVVLLLRWRRVLAAGKWLVTELVIAAPEATTAGAYSLRRGARKNTARTSPGTGTPFTFNSPKRDMRVLGVLESCLSAPDLDAAEQFYTRVIGLEKFAREDGRHVFFRCGDSMVLIFNPEQTSRVPTAVGGSPVPMHGTIGVGHLAFAVREDDIPDWRMHLAQAGVTIESEVRWPHGGRSLYVRDPAGNSIELASPAIWGLSAREPN